MTGHEIESALLTRTETDWLLNNVKISKEYEYRIKSDIKKKLKTFTEIEIPLLIEKGLLDNNNLRVFTQNLRISPQMNNQNVSINSPNNDISAQIWWAGRDLNPRTPPCQGGILTKLDHRPVYIHVKSCNSAL